MGNGKKGTYQIFKKRKNKKRKEKKKWTWSKLKYDFQRGKTSVARSSDCLNAVPSSFDPQLKITVFGEVWVNNVIRLALKTMQSRRGSSSYTSFNS